MSEKSHQPDISGTQSQVTWEYLQSLGFRDGQRLPGPEQVFKNEGLYNISGQKVGWGDLSQGQIAFFTDNLQEPLLLLSEKNSYWRNVSFADFTNTPEGDKTVMLVNKRAESEPGITFVLTHLNALVMPKSVDSKHPGLYWFPEHSFLYTDPDTPEVFPGVKRYKYSGVEGYVVRPRYKYEVMGLMLPNGIKNKIEKRWLSNFYPNRGILEKIKDKLRK